MGWRRYMSCKYCSAAGTFAVHHGMKVPPVMACMTHLRTAITEVIQTSGHFQVTVQDMEMYQNWKAASFTKNYSKPRDNSYYINLVDTWLSGFKSILDAKPIRITFRYARREALTMVIKARDWNNLKLAFLERPEIYKIDDAHLAGGATITHYINRHRAWYLGVWDVAKKIKLVFGPLHLDAYQGNYRIEPAPLGFEEEKPGLSLHNPVTPGFEDAVQTLLEKSLNAVANKKEKPQYLCQSDFCFKCGDRVTNTGGSFGYNQNVVCLKCFKKAENNSVIPSIKCVTCGASNYTHSLGGKVYCEGCWNKLKCCHCDKIVGYDCTSYGGRVYCNACYEKLSTMALKVCGKCKEPKVCPEAITINGNPLCQDCFDKLHSKVCAHCQGPLDLEAMNIDGSPVCKTCYDRFYNPEINYRCKGCGAIIPDKGKICNKCGPECAHCKTHQGPFKTIDHKLYCHGCADLCKPEPKVCPDCGLPLGNHSVALPDNHSVCRSCYNNDPSCVMCGKKEVPLITRDDSELMYCQDCTRKDNKESNG
jgi:hypothetical protein